MVSPKERVRANIYKTLLEEEKKKSKKISVLSLSLFVVGVFTGTSYDLVKRNITPTEKLVALESGELQKRISDKKDIGFTIDDLFQADEIKMNKRDFNTENLFVTDLQI
ncbi:hypothetical protein NON08_03820 [Cetobacterium somerae]|uniref:hypothetical protein n=1 Tax=Cetobacterium sp. NK01 TaxID=2993530 RepID=UPI00211624FB|nr:hypothetical protein [Cetobacterium sp. NK01]MCQ8211685.1 hypothetical protein [Cetobacterium sp. NK01]